MVILKNSELEVELKQISTAPIYELNLKIGTDKKYTLKKVLIPFLLNYQKKSLFGSFKI